MSYKFCSVVVPAEAAKLESIKKLMSYKFLTKPYVFTEEDLFEARRPGNHPLMICKSFPLRNLVQGTIADKSLLFCVTQGQLGPE